MAELSSWFEVNWFNVIQTAGVIGSLALAAAAATREAKAREIENLLTISDHHRELWSGARQRPELERVFREDASVLNAPVTVAEEEFLNLVFAQFLTTWRIANAGGMITRKELATDAAEFFSLPLQRAVWEKTRDHRNADFVRFIDRALK